MAELPELQFDNDLPELSFEDNPQLSRIGELRRSAATDPSTQFFAKMFKSIPFPKRLIPAIQAQFEQDRLARGESEPPVYRYGEEPAAEGLGARLAAGAGTVAPTLILANPFIKGAGALTKLPALLRPAVGFGAYEGARALTQGEEPIEAALGGAGSALAFGAGGRLGASLMPRGMPFVETLGSVLGGAGTGYALSPEDEASAILGGGFGLISPSKRASLSSFGKFGGRGLKSLAGIKPDVYAEAEKIGFRKVLTKENLNPELPAKIAGKIESGFTQRELATHKAYNEALNKVPAGKSINIAPFYNKIGAVLKDMGYITENGKPTGLHENPALRDSAYTKLFDIFQASEGMAGIKSLQGKKSLTESQMIKMFGYGRKGNIRELNVNKEQYIQIRDIIQGLWSGQSKDINLRKVVDQFYLDGETSGAKGLIEAKNLERDLFDAQRELNRIGIVGQRRLQNFAKMTDVEKRKLGQVEEFTGVKFIDDLKNWSLAQEFATKPESMTLNPFKGFGLLPKVMRPALRGYLRGTEKIGSGLDVGQEAINVGSEQFRSGLQKSLQSERGSVNFTEKLPRFTKKIADDVSNIQLAKIKQAKENKIQGKLPGLDKAGGAGMAMLLTKTQNDQKSPYQRISQAETGNESDPWIRTKVAGSGSSAFGEAQITRGLVKTALDNPKKFGLDNEDIGFLTWLKQQQDLMLKYGGKDMKPGFEKYDYGQKGDWSDSLIPKYRKSVGKIIDAMSKQHGKKFWRVWRYGEKGALNQLKQDKRYEKEYNR